MPVGGYNQLVNLTVGSYVNDVSADQQLGLDLQLEDDGGLALIVASDRSMGDEW